MDDVTIAEHEAWHALDPDAVLARLDVDADAGLDAAAVDERRARFGPNELEADEAEPLWKAIARQYESFMQLLLLGAAGVSLLIGQRSTAVLLGVLTIVNAWLGYRQEAKAEASVAALAEMMQVTARVRRGGEIVEVDARELVPGDIVSIEAGDLVPADGRILRAATLEIEESALTGESAPSPKDTEATPGDEVPLGDRHAMAYMNTQVSRGVGTIVVTATGMDTEMGRIAGMLTGVEAELSPLQRQMNQLAKVFAYLAAGTIALMVVAGAVRGLDRTDLFLLAVTVAIGAIPTGLPTVVTTLLSIGTRSLAESNAVVKDLTSVETLGSTSAICSDKTGTLTLNQMTVRTMNLGGVRLSVEGTGYEPIGTIGRPAGATVDLDGALSAVALCSDATVQDGALIGDPTEGALVTVAAKGGIDVGATRLAHPRVAELPFDSAYKLMATFHDWTDDDGRAVVRCFVKGAPDVLLARASTGAGPDGPTPIAAIRTRLDDTNRSFAEEGLRVLAVARRDFDPADLDPDADLLAAVDDLEVLGLFGIVDPPRPEARDAIRVAHQAGIRVRMITGDHAVTAAAIAGELGIDGEAITGADLDHLDDESFAGRVNDIGVFGRVAPEHKVRLVKTLKGNGEIVAMTGDGVNDAPALKAADIGVAMGITGTEVSKQAARMILTDDNFATIVEAVRHGRTIYDNLLKYVRFQTASLVSFITAFVGATLLDVAMGAPLNPVQILWINFVITAVLAIALGFDSPTPGLMDRPPRDPSRPVLDRARWVRLSILGFAMGAVTLAATELAPDQAVLGEATTAGSMALVTMSLATIVAGLACRSEDVSLFATDPFANPRLVRSLIIATVATIASTELGVLQRWMSTVSLSAGQWGLCLCGAAVVLAVDELRKAIERRWAHDRAARPIARGDGVRGQDRAPTPPTT